MSYKNFGKVKTIIIPVDDYDNETSLDVYKEKYGIDLRDYFRFNAQGMQIKDNEHTKNALILINYNGFIKPLIHNTHSSDQLGVCLSFSTTNDDTINISSVLSWDNDNEELIILEY